MTPIVAFTQTTVHEITPATTQLPPLVWNAFALVNKIHATWRWYRRIDLYRNPDNFSQLLIGHIVNFLIGESRILRLAAQCLLVATRLLECVQQQSSLRKSWKKLVAEIRGDRPVIVFTKWEKAATYLSPMTNYWWKYHIQHLWMKIQRISVKVFSLLKNAFKLHMKMMDALDAICWDASTDHDAIPESFVNIKKWLEAAIKNKEQLLQGIDSHREVVEKLLKYSSFTFQQLHDGLEKLLKKTETVYIHTERISRLGNGALKTIGERALNGIKVVSGLT